MQVFSGYTKNKCGMLFSNGFLRVDVSKKNKHIDAMISNNQSPLIKNHEPSRNRANAIIKTLLAINCINKKKSRMASLMGRQNIFCQTTNNEHSGVELTGHMC